MRALSESWIRAALRMRSIKSAKREGSKRGATLNYGVYEKYRGQADPIGFPCICFEVGSLTERRKSVVTRLWIFSCLGSVVLCMLLSLAYAQSSPPSRQSLEKLVDVGPT